MIVRFERRPYKIKNLPLRSLALIKKYISIRKTMKDNIVQAIEKTGFNFFKDALIFILHDKKEDEDWYERPIGNIYFIQNLEDLIAGLILEAKDLGYIVRSVVKINPLSGRKFELILKCSDVLEDNINYTLYLVPIKSASQILSR